MGVAVDQLHAGQRALFQLAQKRRPERFLLARADVETQDVTLTVKADADGNNHSLADNAVVLARFDVDGVQPDVGILALHRPVAKGRNHVSSSWQMRDALLLLMPLQSADQVVDFPRADPFDVRFLDDGQRRFLTPLARFQQAGKTTPLPQLGIRSGICPTRVSHCRGR